MIFPTQLADSDGGLEESQNPFLKPMSRGPLRTAP